MAAIQGNGKTRRNQRENASPISVDNVTVLSTIPVDPIPTPTQARGRRVAIDLLREMESIADTPKDCFCIWSGEVDDGEFCRYRATPTSKQSDVLLQAFRAVQHDDELLKGFTEILTDYIGCAAGGNHRIVDAYDEAEDRARRRRIVTHFARRVGGAR